MIGTRLLNDKNLPLFTLLICIFLSIVLIFSDSNEKVQSFKLYVAERFSFLNKPFIWIGNQSFSSSQIEILKEQNLKLTLENKILLSDRIENDDLREFRKFLNFQDRERYKFVGSNVIARGNASGLNTIIIDRGHSDGVSKNDPVLSSKGIIGKVIMSSDNTSTIQLISDGNFRLSVKIMPSQAEGILRWRSDGVCEIFEVKKTADINIGDSVITSNLSIYFPSDLPVGDVISVHDKSDSFNQSVRLKLYSDLSKLNQLFVMIKGDIQ
mgnify:FL=1|tara:strand:+ start:51 stop:854 length:804 start_codon:yes stop_codon:yes gene_type:complete